MDYALATQLKDAGFPQDHSNWVCQHAPGGHQITDECKKCYRPTLSELIEACMPGISDDFGLTYRQDWEAYFLYVGYMGDFPTRFVDEEGFAHVDVRVHGPTPEEAVTNLWLALNASKAHS